MSQAEPMGRGKAALVGWFANGAGVDGRTADEQGVSPGWPAIVLQWADKWLADPC